MSRRNRSRKAIRSNYNRKINSNHLWGLVFGLVIVIFGIIVYFAFSSKESTEIDVVTLCPMNAELTEAHTIFMIDATDKVTERYTKRLKQHIAKIERSMKKYDKLTILVLSDSEDNYIEEKFSMCSPGRGKDIDPLVGSVKIAEAKWKKTFHLPLEKLLGELENLREAKKTPLINGIKQIMCRLDFDMEVRDRKLFLVSDMMHSTNEFSNYKVKTSKKLLESSFIKEHDFDFSGVDVEVELIKREKLKPYQTREFKTFWESFFEENGANSIRFY